MYRVWTEIGDILRVSEETLDAVFSDRRKTSEGMGGYLYPHEETMGHISLCRIHWISVARGRTLTCLQSLFTIYLYPVFSSFLFLINYKITIEGFRESMYRVVYHNIL